MKSELEIRIAHDLENALRNRHEVALRALRVLASALHNFEIEKRGKGNGETLSEEEVRAVVAREVKKRKEAIELFTKGGRDDLAQNERAEIEVLSVYLPPELTDEELEKTLSEMLRAPAFKDERHMGKLMGEAMKRLKGKADAKRVQAFLTRLLG